MIDKTQLINDRFHQHGRAAGHTHGSIHIRPTFYHIRPQNFAILKPKTTIAGMKRVNHDSTRALYRECGIAFVTWLLIFLFLLLRQPSTELTGYAALVFPYAIAFYWFCYARLIPGIIARGQDYRIYLLKVIGVISLTVLPIVSVTSKLDRGLYLTAGIFSLAFQLVFTAPLAWEVYHYRLRNSREIRRLKTALGKSDADYRFLQSQINPHFLYNALNTLLGMSLRENAEKTAEGIQILGDMMRFMLHEHHHDLIPLHREIDYIRSFIALQELRIGDNSGIRIETSIAEPGSDLEILPMVLIPFVENAFKHGISLRKASFIRISLRTEGQDLYAEVVNSVHARQKNDPEKENSGIGLNNVRQRLQLIYPGRHELLITETAEEFRVRLRLELNTVTK